MNNPENIEVPDTVTATDKLNTIFNHKGPYVSVYLATLPLLPDGSKNFYESWKDIRSNLESNGAPLPAINAIEARVSLPVPDDAGGICVIAASDGATVVDYGMEPPKSDVGVVDTLPYSAPLLEWQQRRVPHLVVTVDDAGADVITFGLENYTSIDKYSGSALELLEPIASHVNALDAKLIVLAGSPKLIKELADRLVTKVPVNCRIVTDSADKSVEDLSQATVRYVSDTVARTTVNYLSEQQFLSEHDAAVDGTNATVKAVGEGSAEVLLIHDNPTDQRRLWLGELPYDLSLEERPGYKHQARIIDALIASAVLQDINIRIIPSTGSQGPDEDIAALTRTDPESPSI